MARDAALRPPSDESSLRPSAERLERAAAGFGSIHERWSDLTPGPISAPAAIHDVGERAPLAPESEPISVAPKARESFPPPSPSSQPRPQFDTLIGVPRSSFAPVEGVPDLRASTDALAAPVAEEPKPRPGMGRVLALAAMVTGAVIAVVRYQPSLRAELERRLHSASTPSVNATQSVAALRATHAMEVESKPPPQGARDIQDPSMPPPLAAAQQITAGAAAVDSAAVDSAAVEADQGASVVAKAPAKTARDASRKRTSAASKRVAKARKAGAAPKESSARDRDTLSRDTLRDTPRDTLRDTLRDTAAPSKVVPAKVTQRAKPSSPAQMQSRKNVRAGIIRQNPF